MEPISKKILKLDKSHRKRQLIHIQNSQHSQNLTDERKFLTNDDYPTEPFIDPETQLKKAKEWWHQLDKDYFKSLTRKNFFLAKDLTSGQRLRSFFNFQQQLESSFEEEQILRKFSLLRQKNLIHVLFKSFSPFLMELVSYSFVNYVQYTNKKCSKPFKQQENEQTIDMNDKNDFKLTPTVIKLGKKASTNRIQQQTIDQVVKIANFQLQAILQDDLWTCKFEKTMQIKKEMEFSQDINVQLKLWENEVDQQNTQNSILWNNLISNHQNIIEIQQQNFHTQVAKIRQNLMHFTIIRYIIYGTKDKTQQMIKQLLENMKQIKPAKTRQLTYKKFFQTDCKICFCSFNSDCNQVLYCDMCNTSFHLACYGLRQVPQDKEYFCDRCSAIRKDQKTKGNIRKITCQICSKPNFPIKQIGGHFYHMTCLILLNFITIRDGHIELREGLSHQKIIKRVIENQIECHTCIFCVGSQNSQLGMQFRCSVPECQCSIHPICAYINGCQFQIEKNMTHKRVEVMIRCNQHDCQRDYIQQTYLRRYMCNFKNTSQKSLQSFRAEYKAQTKARLEKVKSSHQAHNQLPRLIFDSKIIRKHVNLREPKSAQKPVEIQNTEIRKILQKLQKPKNRL